MGAIFHKNSRINNIPGSSIIFFSCSWLQFSTTHFTTCFGKLKTRHKTRYSYGAWKNNFCQEKCRPPIFLIWKRSKHQYDVHTVEIIYIRTSTRRNKNKKMKTTTTQINGLLTTCFRQKLEWKLDNTRLFLNIEFSILIWSQFWLIFIFHFDLLQFSRDEWSVTLSIFNVIEWRLLGSFDFSGKIALIWSIRGGVLSSSSRALWLWNFLITVCKKHFFSEILINK